MLAPMGSQNVELLRDVFARWGKGDFSPDPRFEDYTITMGSDFPDSGVHRGRAAVAAYMKGFLEP